MRRQRPSPGGRDPTSALVGGRAPWHAAAFVLALAAGSWPVIRQLGSASGFDEGVYLDSLRSLEHGHVLGS